MCEKWKQFDFLMIPLVFTAPNGPILYKNSLAREMDMMRVGSNLTGKMDIESQTRFVSLTGKGTILTIMKPLGVYRCVAFPAVVDGTELVAMLFPEVLLGNKRDGECEKFLLKLVPSLRRLLCEMSELPYMLGKSIGKKSSTVRLMILMRKILDLYLSDGNEEDFLPVDVGYFISVLTYFFKEVFRYQGVLMAISDTASECGYCFYEHRKLTAMLLSVIELMIDRTGGNRMYIDIYSEAGEAVIMFSSILNGEWVMPDDSLPDAFILFELLRRNGIHFEFFTTVVEDTPRMICRLFLPSRIAKQSFSVHSRKEESQYFIIDFLDYLAS